MPETGVGGGSAPQSASLSEDGKKVALSFHDHVEGQVGLAATTAYLVLVANTILINAFVYVFKDFALHDKPLTPCLAIAPIIAGALLALGTLMALVAVIPASKARDSFFYYRMITKQTMEQWCNEFKDRDAQGMLEQDLLRAVWGKSLWLGRMFKFARWGIFFTVAGTLSMMLAVFLLAIN